MARFEELEVWRRSARLSADLYKVLSGLKDFGFRDQITRAGLSIPSNIAEEHERGTNKEIANFLNYAKVRPVSSGRRYTLARILDTSKENKESVG